MWANSEARRSLSKRVMAGASVLLTLGLLRDQVGIPSLGERKNVGETCQQVVNSTVALSRQQLAQLLSISEGDQKERIRKIIKEPYCNLANLQVRAGAIAQREAYPMEFDQQTWLVLLYEGNQYTGYRFAVR